MEFPFYKKKPPAGNPAGGVFGWSLPELLNDFGEHQDSQHNADQGIQTDRRAEQAEDKADDRQTCQQADDETAHHVDHNVDEQRDVRSFTSVARQENGKNVFKASMYTISFRLVALRCL